MIANYHTHTTFCDGKNTPEEVILTAIEKGFTVIGFSGHGFTAFDRRYCMEDTAGYLRQMRELKEKYRGKIHVIIGSEEDAFAPVDRSDYEYIIGSSHYFRDGDQYYPIDSGPDYFARCLELFGGDHIRLAQTYYEQFCGYLAWRKPDIIGHFDLVTKFEERTPMFFNDPRYQQLSQKYLLEAIKTGCVFEVNTGAISRGYRTTPYPSREMLHTLKKHDARLILSSDSHRADTIDFAFEEAKLILKDVGFTHVYTFLDGQFVKDPLY